MLLKYGFLVQKKKKVLCKAQRHLTLWSWENAINYFYEHSLKFKMNWQGRECLQKTVPWSAD